MKHRIRNTKEFTPKQALKMAENLWNVYEEFASIQCSCDSYAGNNDKEYWVYVRGIYSQPLNTWSAVISKYHELMEGE
jgi:hypothetical protein